VNIIHYWESLHTHALHDLSWQLKNYYLQENLYSLITWLFFIGLRIFDELSDYFLRFRCIFVNWFLLKPWPCYLPLFFCSLEMFRNVWLWFFSNNLFTLCPFETKREEYFLLLDSECIFKPVKYFLSQNGQMESLLVFYVGNILVNKNLHFYNDPLFTKRRK
jgi:hypothetical protein